MITNVDYLIKKYAEAREKMLVARDAFNESYWRGSMDTYHNLLCIAFDGWADHGSTGYYVLYEQMSYDEALDQVTGILK